jgi:hypothetical protein
MPKTCTACSHDKRKQIDKLIIQGLSDRLISIKAGGIGQQVIQRHRAHVAQALVAGFERRQEKADDELVDMVKTLMRNAERVYDKAARFLDKPDDEISVQELRAVGLAIGDQRELIETLGKLLGRIGPGDTVVNNYTLVQIAPVLYRVLEKHPLALKELEAAVGTLAPGA